LKVVNGLSVTLASQTGDFVGGRIHHKIISKYLYPRLIKTVGVNNIRWDTYPEDAPFTNENLTNKDVV